MVTTSKDLELIEILEKQIEVEKTTLIELSELEEKISEPSVRLVLMSMRLDTWKHQKFLEGVVQILNETPCDLWSEKVQRYVDRIKLERKIDSLMDQEASMIDYLGQAISLMSDSVGVMLLEHLRDDEKRHNEDLKKLIRIIQQSPLQSKKGEKGSDIECKE
jgi:rubrerythrin